MEFHYNYLRYFKSHLLVQKTVSINSMDAKQYTKIQGKIKQFQRRLLKQCHCYTLVIKKIEPLYHLLLQSWYLKNAICFKTDDCFL